MAFIQENLLELNIGLKQEYKIIHFSDVHAVTYNETDPEEVKVEALKGEDIWYKQRTWFADKAHEYHDESHMIPSKECLINLVKYTNKERPIAVVMTGDIIDYYSEANYDLLLEQCGEIKYPFVFSCGNHETPVERFVDITNDKKGFTVLDCNEFKIVSLDNSTKKINRYTLNNLKEELEEDKPIIISMHIPISTKWNQEEMKMYDPYFVIYDNDTDKTTKELIDLLINDDRIKAILCGHVHGHSESCFAPNKPQYCASSGLIGLVNKIIVK